MDIYQHQKWREVIQQHLGRKVASRHVDEIVLHMLAVDHSIKPAFLYDYSSKSPREMHHFVSDISQHSLLGPSSSLQVLTVDMDVFIINRQNLLSFLEGTSLCGFVVVDVTSGHTPTILPFSQSKVIVTDIIRTVIDQLKKTSSNEDIICLDLQEHINRTTVFGLLVGYPVLYWYNAKDEGNCLDFVPLCLNKVFLDFMDQTMGGKTESTTSVTMRECVYSFSFPDMCKESLSGCVELWCKTIKQKVEGLCAVPIRWHKFEQQIVTLPAVAL